MTKTAAVSTPSSIITDDMFATDDIIEREIKLPDGKKHTLYFRELSAIEFKRHIEAERSKDKKVREQAAATLIARSVVEPDGRRAMTAAKAATLKPAVSGAIFMAIMEINGVVPQLSGDVADSVFDEDDDEGN